jgi:hypothetical protein
MAGSKRVALRILVAAREEIAKPYGWTKGTGHKRVRVKRPGQVTEVVDAFCLSGALAYVSGYPGGGGSKNPRPVIASRESYALARDSLKVGYGCTSTLVYFNDRAGTKKKDVVGALDRAIASLRESLASDQT